MKIFIDHRENANLIQTLKGMFEDITITQLPLGDYFICPDPQTGVLVERKTTSDFINSMRSNHLWEQLLRMMQTPTLLDTPVSRRILLIHGTFEQYLASFTELGFDGSPQTFWNSLNGAKQEILFVYDTPVVAVENEDDFKAFFKILVQREQSAKNNGAPKAHWQTPKISPTLPVKEGRKILLSTIPHIGDTLAGNLLKQFPTVKDIACASLDDLQTVPGIGKRKAEAIFSFFR